MTSIPSPLPSPWLWSRSRSLEWVSPWRRQPSSHETTGRAWKIKDEGPTQTPTGYQSQSPARFIHTKDKFASYRLSVAVAVAHAYLDSHESKAPTPSAPPQEVAMVMVTVNLFFLSLSHYIWKGGRGGKTSFPSFYLFSKKGEENLLFTSSFPPGRKNLGVKFLKI